MKNEEKEEARPFKEEKVILEWNQTLYYPTNAHNVKT
jgi:hypothetical protein